MLGRVPGHIAAVTLLVVLAISQPARTADLSQAPPLKSGWSDDEFASFTGGCVSAIVLPARRDYYARAEERGNSSPEPFPEDELVASVQPMCACIARRIAEVSDLQDPALNPGELGKPFIEEALQGGRCKPAGVLGEMLEKKRSRG